MHWSDIILFNSLLQTAPLSCDNDLHLCGSWCLQQLLPLHVLEVWKGRTSHITNRYSNRTHERNVTSKLKSESDRKRDRTRNLVPAKAGIYVLILIVIYTTIHTLSYVSYSDTGTREYFLSLAIDLLSCIIAPGILVFQAPSITRKMNKTFSTFMQVIGTKMSITGTSTDQVSSGDAARGRNTEISRHNNGWVAAP